MQGRNPEGDCEEEEYRNDALMLLYETTFSALFRDLHNQTKFEASGVEFVNSTYYTIFDRFSHMLSESRNVTGGDSHVCSL